jgi:hypothetical protein
MKIADILDLYEGSMTGVWNTGELHALRGEWER